MKFNTLKISNRDYADIGDLKTCLYNLSLTNKNVDRSTLATVISVIDFIASKFSEKQPKEQLVYVVQISDGIFNKEVNRVLKENKKTVSKKDDSNFVVVDQEAYDDEQIFSMRQIDQLKEIQRIQNTELKKIFEEAVSKIKINGTETSASTSKKKPSA